MAAEVFVKFRFKGSKLGQSEMIGLVIIVIMITLGMLFLAKFALQDDSSEKIFTRKGLAYSTMSSLLKSEVACVEPGNSRVKVLSIGLELIDDCAANYASTLNSHDCFGMHSCAFMQQEIEIMLNETLGVWQKDYVFQSRLLAGEEPILIDVRGGSGCAGSSNRDTSGLFPIFVTDIGIVENILYLCD